MREKKFMTVFFNLRRIDRTFNGQLHKDATGADKKHVVDLLTKAEDPVFLSGHALPQYNTAFLGCLGAMLNGLAPEGRNAMPKSHLDVPRVLDLKIKMYVCYDDFVSFCIFG